MRWFTQWSIRTQFISSFLLIAMMAAAIGAVGIWATSQVNQMATQMYTHEVAGVRHAGGAQIRLLAAGQAVRSALLAHDKGARIGDIYFMRDHLESMKAEIEKLRGFFSTESGRAAVDDALAAVLDYEAALLDIAAQLERSGMETEATTQLLAALQQAAPLGEKAEMLMNMLILEKQNSSGALANQTSAIYHNALNLVGGLTLAGAVLAILLGVALTRGLMRQLGGETRDVVQVVDMIAQGDLGAEVDTGNSHPLSIMRAMGQMQDSLRNVVSQVRLCSDRIVDSARQMALRNTELAGRTDDQSANLTETASAMEQLSSTVQSNAEVARTAAELAASTSTKAQTGGRIVQEVVATMGTISDSSRQIVEIISVIDSIAFQTNILALNAAVEAARAGEHGKGFAVVASEVRNLALKSASAAQDIKDLITASVEKVDAGGKQVSQAGTAMVEIVGQIQAVSTMINDISAATTEQTSGIHQINEAVMQLSLVTQKNALLVQESTVATNDLNVQAGQLLEAVSVFKLTQEDSPMQGLEGPDDFDASDIQHAVATAFSPQGALPQLSLQSGSF